MVSESYKNNNIDIVKWNDLLVYFKWNKEDAKENV